MSKYPFVKRSFFLAIGAVALLSAAYLIVWSVVADPDARFISIMICTAIAALIGTVVSVAAAARASRERTDALVVKLLDEKGFWIKPFIVVWIAMSAVNLGFDTVSEGLSLTGTGLLVRMGGFSWDLFCLIFLEQVGLLGFWFGRGGNSAS